MPQLSIIIPTLNEAEHLPDLLADLAAQHDLEAEILIADGGSTDGTLEIADSRGAQSHDTTVIKSAPGRGRQMNAAAAQAKADYLLFLHADCRLPKPRLLANALQHLRREDAGAYRSAGHFPLHFERNSKQHELAFRYMEGKTLLNRRHCQNGDQGLLLHRAFFGHLGGFDESLPFFEDFRIAERIHEKGRWITLPGHLTTSARRFEREGVRARYLLMAFIVIAQKADIPEFMEQAPDAYACQDATGHLLLTPYFRTFAGIARQRGLRGAWRALLNIGRLSRHHWWQCFYFLDTLFSLRSQPFLRFYDRAIYPLSANRAGDAITAVLAWVVGMWLLRAYFRLREHDALRKLKHRH